MSIHERPGLFDKPLDELITQAKEWLEKLPEVVGTDNLAHIINFSGGKDSTAMYLLACELGIDFTAVFADTGWEHEAVYEQVRLVPEVMCRPPIQIVKANHADKLAEKRQKIADAGGDDVDKKIALLETTGYELLDQAVYNHQFASPQLRFCTGDLKIKVISKYCYEPAIAEGKTVISWQGVRRAESANRALLDPYEDISSQPKVKGPSYAFRPLLDFKLEQIWEMHARHNMPRNRLYELGVSRVGCFPCIFANKGEIAIIAKESPERIDVIERTENRVNEYRALVGKEEVASFFPHSKAPDKAVGIREVVKWANSNPKQWRASKDDELSKKEIEGFRATGEEPDHNLCDLLGACE